MVAATVVEGAVAVAEAASDDDEVRVVLLLSRSDSSCAVRFMIAALSISQSVSQSPWIFLYVSTLYSLFVS